MAQKGVQVIAVEPGSLAFEAGIQAGDTLLEINGEPVLDQLSYQFLITQRDRTEVAYRTPAGQPFTSRLPYQVPCDGFHESSERLSRGQSVPSSRPLSSRHLQRL